MEQFRCTVTDLVTAFRQSSAAPLPSGIHAKKTEKPTHRSGHMLRWSNNRSPKT
jgi:hypothetical protein